MRTFFKTRSGSLPTPLRVEAGKVKKTALNLSRTRAAKANARDEHTAADKEEKKTTRKQEGLH